MAAETDSQGRPIVVVTGMGVLSSLGQGQDDNWAALTAGRSGIHTLTRFPIDKLRTTFAGTVDFLSLPEPSAPALCERLAELAIEEAVAEAGLGRPGWFPGPLFVAMPPVELEWPHRLDLAAAAPGADPDALSYADLLRAAATGRFAGWHERFLFGAIPEHLADRFGTQGSPVALSTACASGATAIQLGMEAIRRGETEAAICAGTDASVTPEGLIRFSLLSALSTRNDDPAGAARPFTRDRDGFVMAEGAGALVLESLRHARARGARILAVVEGGGERADSFHRTRTSPDGMPVIATLQRALDDAGIGPDDVGYINAHGTSTPENDKMEWHAVSAVFGARAAAVPISSNKSMIGHTLSAAGAIEAVFTVKTLREGRLPPTINYHTPDPALPVDCVPNVAREASVFRAISNSFGFGGQNVCLVIAAEPR
jgi:3-oxoacyl-[acyl-carrier-protein] synthase II